MQFLANLFGAGHEAPVRYALREAEGGARVPAGR